MIDPSQEALLPLVQAVQQATGLRVNLSTAIRWSKAPNGLETLKVGGRRLTSKEAVFRMISRSTHSGNATINESLGDDAKIAAAEQYASDLGV